MAKKKTTSSAPTTLLLGGQTVTVPASFGFPVTKSPSTPQLVQKQVAAVAQVVTQIVANTPAVIDTPKGKAPKPEEIKPIVQQTVQAVAPIIAPYLPSTALQNIANNVETAIISSPEIKNTDVGQTVPPQIVNKIAESTVEKFTTTNIGGSIVTAPADFGLPNQRPKTQVETPSANYATNLGRIFAGLPQEVQQETKREIQKSSVPPAPMAELGGYFGGVGPAPTQEQMEEVRVISEMPSFPRQTDIPTPNVGGFGVTLPQDFFGNFNLAEFQAQYGYTPEVPAGSTVPGTPTGTTTTAATDTTTANKVSAFDRLRDRLKARGLDGLYDAIKGLIEADLPEEEFTIQLRQLPAYTQRFAANEKRISKGLRPLSEAQYLLLEDQYQDVMRRYGLPETYYTRGALGVQPGFEKFLESDVSPVELEDRIQTAQQRVINAAPEIKQAFEQFYSGVTEGDILGYVLNPSRDTLNEIKRKATAAEIGGAARGAGLYAGQRPEDIAALRARAEQLGQAGVTQAEAQKGFQTVAELAPRGSQLAAIYEQTPYTQTTAEQEVFGLAGSAEAARQRKKLTQLETAAFSGQTGMGALARDRAGAF